MKTSGRRILKGKLSVTRPTRADGRTSISIQLEDASSGCRLVEIDVDPEQFGLAVTGASYQSCSYEYFVNCPAGKIREVKTEQVPRVPSSAGWKREDQKAAAYDILAPYEVDGWEAYVEDMLNSHRWDTKDGVAVSNVTFIRFVDPPEEN